MFWIGFQTPPAVIVPAPDTFAAADAAAVKAQQNGQKALAISLFGNALQMARDHKDRHSEWRALMQLSLCYSDFGSTPLPDLDTSIRYTQQAIECIEKNSSVAWQTSERDLAYNLLSTDYINRAHLKFLQPEEARKDFVLALTAEEKKTLPARDYYWLYIAVCYNMQQDLNNVEACLEKVIPFSLDTVERMVYYLLQSTVCIAHKDREGTRANLITAAALKGADASPLAQWQLKSLIAQFFDPIPEEKKGEETTIDSVDAAMLMIASGLSAIASNQTDKARQQLQTASRYCEQKHLHLWAAACQTPLGVLEAQSKNFVKAQTHFDYAVRYYEDLNVKALDPSLFGSIQALSPNLYGNYADMLIQNSKPSEALVMADRGRGQGLKHLAAMRQNQTRQASANVAAMLSASPQQITALVGLHPDTLYLHFNLVDDEHSLLFALSAADGIQVFRLPGTPRLEQTCANWVRTLKIPLESVVMQNRHQGTKNNEPVLANHLFTMLLDDVEKAGLLKPGRFKRLVILPDGPLWSIPFAALQDGQGSRLIDRYPITLAVSLALQQEPAVSRDVSTIRYVADPFGNNSHLQGGGKPFMNGSDSLRLARSTVLKIVAGYSGPAANPHALGLLGPDASEKRVRELLPSGDILLFATHSVVAPDTLTTEQESSAERWRSDIEGVGLKSYLRLAPEPIHPHADRAQDGKLEADEVLQLRLQAQLAILMACGSGQGRFGGGEGLLGLVWAFEGAGCKSVLASEWSVDENASSVLVEAFWKNIASGQAKDEALQQAIHTVRKQQGCAYPFYWAAFQLYGVSSALKIKSSVHSPTAK